MSVFDNMAFGLKLQKVPKHEINSRVQEAARILGLDELLNRKPAALSGGNGSESRWAVRSCATPRRS